MIIADHYMGTYGMFQTPMMAFHIGPGRGNPLGGEDNFNRRSDDVRRLLVPGTPEFAALDRALGQALGMKVRRLHAEVRCGGWKGTLTPDLCINSFRSVLDNGSIIYPRVTPEVARELCRSLLDILEADWVACQHFFGNQFQVEFRAEHKGGGHA
jgi:hypothetical protein